MKSLSCASAIMLTIIALQSCSKPAGWTVDGTIDGGANRKIAIEQNVGGAWVLLDSIDVDNEGKFSYTAAEAAPFADLYRLSLDDARLFFPIDSVDHVTVTTTAADFGGRYMMSGSQAAENIASANKLIYHYIDSLDVNRAMADPQLKSQLYNLFKDGKDLMTPYYLMYRNIDGRPLFDIVNRDMDYRMLGAVATKFLTQAPDDPRSKFFEQIYNQERQRRNPQYTRYEAQVVGAPGDIKSLNTAGEESSLYSMLSKGKPVLLSFAQYSDDTAKPYTMVLNSLYEKYHGQGLEIFQVSFDNEETDWLEFGSNLSWTSVWGPAITSGNPIVIYNVDAVPMSYLFDGEGNLVERVADYTKLDQSVAKLF